ncbi:hypothetical protein BCU70_01385 [Vibrio sp. 10N.286.49.C2]|uniref:alkyl/aryl-sulfatase n=1 Tax=unclassified Vibrio TaxID=2614977 RepID=UPI000C856AD2|nr:MULTISPECIES: alkyl sulfatase dimerization domain-containing protein [unclassified Vibrio]PMH42840.1 hypothetical protein BCU70_01385 [Vibrio sp. 10N.286.49.C2]PMH53821.1 hypothetical protein BCU66_13450 [Vibrio sp. 10N.286.49.B1]PMH83101.1 hypothetical protein BCU58_15965 [Vibrio sp. 10N.286.48.B7]
MKKTIIATTVIVSLMSINLANAETQNDQQKPASTYTQKANNAVYEQFPFQDQQSFADAQRGFIAPLNNDGIVTNKDGVKVWNLKEYTDFIKLNKKSPNTVNPSLWRQSQLVTMSGLFEVVPGVYQVRGQDLSNMTIVEGDKGITIYDPLISAETAKSALELYYQHRPNKPVVAVVITHSHVDHFGGLRGVVNEDDVKAGKVKIYAPEGFMDNAIAENVLAGTAMSRRASYMYGNANPAGEKGAVGAGLGVTTSSGTVTLIPPTNIISKTGQTEVIDGIEYQFIMAPGSEAPSEMMWYMPKFKMINTAEDAVHTMHNLYTLRGAKTRDAAKWPDYLTEVIQTWGDKAEVAIGMHHWPEWGNKEVVSHIKTQRDTYKFIHDQTLHYANMGYTMNELPDKVVLPKSLVEHWGTHGYYGSKSHNVRAVYNYYLGFFDGNPSDLNKLPPVEESQHYVEAMGGPDAVMVKVKEAYNNGEYRWAATLGNDLVFAYPDNQQAKYLQADILEQMGYQAENGTWRNFYLSGANELRHGITKSGAPNTSSMDMIANMSTKLVFDYMGVQLDAQRADGKNITINYVFPDSHEKFALELENSVLNTYENWQAKDADVTVTLDRSTLNNVIAGKVQMQDAIKGGDISFKGNDKQFYALMGMLDNLEGSFWFNMVTP